MIYSSGDPVDSYSITYIGKDGVVGKDGKDGKDGAPGKDGKDAEVPVTIREAEGSVLQIEDGRTVKEFRIDGQSYQETRDGKNKFNYEDIAKIASGVTINKDGWVTATLDNSAGTSEKYLQYYTNNLDILTNTQYCAVIEIKTVSGEGRLHPLSKTNNEGQFPDGTNYQFSNLQAGNIKIQKSAYILLLK